MLVGFVTYRGVVHSKYALCLFDVMCYKLLQRWEFGECQIHHDNAPAYSARLMWRWLYKYSNLQDRQPPCPLYMGHCDLFLFPKFKKKKH